MAEYVLTCLGDGVLRLTLNRPEKRNPLSLGMLNALAAALDQAAREPSVRVVVLAGAGPAFSAGHDLAEMIGREETDYRELFDRCSGVMLGIRNLPVPVIAQVQGPAFAAGCQLVAACDLAVAADTALFATPGVKIGLFCTTPMVPLLRAVPAKAASEMLFTGTPISAARALALGLVNRVVPATQLDQAVAEFTQAIRTASPAAVRIGKQAMRAIDQLDEQSAYHAAVGFMTANALEHDAQEGMAAFLAKRQPCWKTR